MFPTERVLLQHKTSQHGKYREALEECKFCDYRAIDQKSWLLHVNKHHQMQISNIWIACTVCKLFLPDEQSLDSHMNSSSGHRETKASHACSFCSKVFATTYRLYTHANDQHLQQLQDHWLPCSLCKSHLPDESSLKNHTVQAHQRPFKPPKPVTCKFCSKICFTENNYILHANASHLHGLADSGWTSCSACHGYFPDENTYNEHKHSDFLSAAKAGTGREMKCPFCQKNFQTLEVMCAHVKRRHLEMVPSSWIPCALCQFSLPSVPSFALHNQQTHSLFTCFECLKKFSAQCMLLTHAKQKHALLSVDDWLQNPDSSMKTHSHDMVPQNSYAYDNNH